MSLPSLFKPMPGDYAYKAVVTAVRAGKFTVELTAKGSCPNMVLRQNFAPYLGLPFALVFEGIIGPRLPIPRLIEFKQNLTLRKLPSLNFLIIIDEKHPTGVRVPLDTKPGLAVPLTASSGDQPAITDLSQLIVTPPKHINVFVGQEFSIGAKINVEGNRNNYEPEKLDLIEAGTDGSNQIFWKYRAIAPGTTTITVTQGFGWDILEWEVIVLPPPGNFAAANSTQEFVDFLEGLGRAVDIVRKTWPTAELYYVQAEPRPLQVDAVHSPYQLSWLTVTFFTDKHAIVIKSIGGWAVWDSPQARARHIPDNQKIAWPLEGGLGLVEAFDAVQNADPLRLPIEDAWLHYPLLQPDDPNLKDQPLYYFVTTSGSQWAIGTKSKIPVQTYEPEIRLTDPVDASDPFVPKPSGGFNATGFIKIGEETNGLDNSSSALVQSAAPVAAPKAQLATPQVAAA